MADKSAHKAKVRARILDEAAIVVCAGKVGTADSELFGQVGVGLTDLARSGA